MRREKSGLRAEHAGQCLKLRLVHIKLRTHPQIYPGMDVTAEGKWEPLPIPSVAFRQDWAEGRQNPGCEGGRGSGWMNAGKVRRWGHCTLSRDPKGAIAFNIWHFGNQARALSAEAQGSALALQTAGQGTMTHLHLTLSISARIHIFFPLRLLCHGKPNPVLTELVWPLQGEAVGPQSHVPSFPYRQSWKFKCSIHHTRPECAGDCVGTNPLKTNPTWLFLGSVGSSLFGHTMREMFCALAHHGAPCNTFWGDVSTAHTPWLQAMTAPSSLNVSPPSLTFACNVQMEHKDGIRINLDCYPCTGVCKGRQSWLFSVLGRKGKTR